MQIKIGSKLAQLRKEAKFTQKELADILEVRPATIGHWEQDRNEPSYEMLNRLTSLYGISISELFGEKPAAESLSEGLKNTLLYKIIDMLIAEGAISEDTSISFESLDDPSKKMLKGALDKIIAETYKNKNSSS